MTLELSADEVLTTTRSVRRRLDLEKEVSPEILRVFKYCLTGSDWVPQTRLALRGLD